MPLGGIFFSPLSVRSSFSPLNLRAYGISPADASNAIGPGRIQSMSVWQDGTYCTEYCTRKTTTKGKEETDDPSPQC